MCSGPAIDSAGRAIFRGGQSNPSNGVKPNTAIPRSPFKDVIEATYRTLNIDPAMKEPTPLRGLVLPNTKPVGVPDLKNLVSTRIRRP